MASFLMSRPPRLGQGGEYASQTRRPMKGAAITCSSVKVLGLCARESVSSYSPPWPRRGGCAIKKISRSNLSLAQTGRFVQLPINRWLEPTFVYCCALSGLRLRRPVRSIKGGFAASFLMSRPPRLGQGGECAS